LAAEGEETSGELDGSEDDGWGDWVDGEVLEAELVGRWEEDEMTVLPGSCFTVDEIWGLAYVYAYFFLKWRGVLIEETYVLTRR
jgi:hypothetical protein